MAAVGTPFAPPPRPPTSQVPVGPTPSPPPRWSAARRTGSPGAPRQEGLVREHGEGIMGSLWWEEGSKWWRAAVRVGAVGAAGLGCFLLPI